MPSQSLLDYLGGGGVVIGDGSFIFTLERRGYAKCGLYTPEAVVEHPEAVRQLSREFARAGAHVIQACTFGANVSRLAALSESTGVSCERINADAVEIAREAAASVDGYVCGSVTPTKSFGENATEEVVKEEFRAMVDIFVETKVDLVLGEFFGDVTEATWALEEMRRGVDDALESDDEMDGKRSTTKKSPAAVGVTMRLGPTGDSNGVSPGECAVRLRKAGADIVGVNCGFDPETSLKTISMMSEGLDEAGLDAYLVTQPCGFHCREVENTKKGFYVLPEYPYAFEPRALTRLDVYEYARKAFDLGVRYIGGCRGFEPHHVRAIAMELEEETGRLPPGRRHADKWAESSKSVYENRRRKSRRRLLEGSRSSRWSKEDQDLGRKSLRYLEHLRRIVLRVFIGDADAVVKKKIASASPSNSTLTASTSASHKKKYSAYRFSVYGKN